MTRHGLSLMEPQACPQPWACPRSPLTGALSEIETAPSTGSHGVGGPNALLGHCGGLVSGSSPGG